MAESQSGKAEDGEGGWKPCSSVDSEACPGSGTELALWWLPHVFLIWKKLDAARWAGGWGEGGAGEMRRATRQRRRMAGKEGGAPGDSQTFGAFSSNRQQLASALLSAPFRSSSSS